MKKIVGLAAIVFALGSAAIVPSSAIAQVNVNITLGEAPPPLRFESIPPARNGYLWAPGYWGWDGNRHVWSAGHWERNRPDYDYVRPEWRQEDGNWRFVKGGWKKGRHHDNGRRHEHERDNEGHHDDEHGDDRGNGRGDGDHCPPGQAKKGNC